MTIDHTLKIAKRYPKLYQMDIIPVIVSFQELQREYGKAQRYQLLCYPIDCLLYFTLENNDIVGNPFDDLPKDYIVGKVIGRRDYDRIQRIIDAGYIVGIRVKPSTVNVGQGDITIKRLDSKVVMDCLPEYDRNWLELYIDTANDMHQYEQQKAAKKSLTVTIGENVDKPKRRKKLTRKQRRLVEGDYIAGLDA